MSMKPSRAACLLATFLAPHGAAFAAQERGLEKVKSDAEGGQTRLHVRVEADDGAGVRALGSGETLRTGNEVRFFVSVDSAAYVYVLEYFADGSAQVLHPETGDARLPKGREVRIPEPGYSFRLNDQVGEEQLYFLASARPLDIADPRLSEAVRKMRAAPTQSAGPRPSVADPFPPPQGFGLATRGLVKVSATDSSAVVESGGDGIAIYHFSIRHLPRR